MRKYIAFFILLFFIFIKVKALELTKYAESAILIEPTTGKVIYDLNMNEEKAPASMTKLMTLLLIMEALDNGNIGLHDMVTISENAASMGGSQVFLEANSQIEVEQLIKGISIASGNDSAVAMAEYLYGSTDEFVNKMNEKVKELGLLHTHFVNVHGLDSDDHYSSAYDMAQIAIELLKHEKILEYTSLYEDYLIKPDGTKTWLVNTNKLVRFYEGVDGLKTGYTKNAKYCLTSTAKKNDIRYITVVMGADTSEHRSADTTSMLNYAFSTFKLNNIVSSNDVVGNVSVIRGVKDKIDVYPKEDINDLVNKNEDKNYSYSISYDEVSAPILKGDVVGTLKVMDNDGNLVKNIDLIVHEDVDKFNFFSLYYDLFKKMVNGYL